MADEGENSEAIVNAIAQPDVKNFFVDLLSEVKKMNERFTNLSYVDEDEPPLSSTDQNEDEADADGIETASLDAQVAQLTAKKQDSDLLADKAQDLDV